MQSVPFPVRAEKFSETCHLQETFVKACSETLFVIEEKGVQPKCPSPEEWLNMERSVWEIVFHESVQ